MSMICSVAVFAATNSEPYVAVLLEAFKTFLEIEGPFYCNTLLQEVTCSFYLQRLYSAHFLNFQL